MSRPFVVAVSGVSGAGKTSVVRRTVEILGDAVALHFDDYAPVSTYPADLVLWFREGAHVDAWQTPHLAADLRRLRNGEAIALPETGRIIEPASCIVVEEPFGRLRVELAGLIDFAAHIEVPADVLLARRLLRRMTEERGRFGESLLDQLQRDLTEHLSAGHQLDALAATIIANAADLILDGRNSIDTIANELAAAVKSNLIQGSAAAHHLQRS
jgi:uridine kinase